MERTHNENDEDNRQSGIGGTVGLIAGVIGVGVGIGAALYYFANKNQETQQIAGSSSSEFRHQQNLHQPLHTKKINHSSSIKHKPKMSSSSSDYDSNDSHVIITDSDSSINDYDDSDSSIYHMLSLPSRLLRRVFISDRDPNLNRVNSSSSSESDWECEFNNDSSSTDYDYELIEQPAPSEPVVDTEMNKYKTQIFLQRTWSLEECSVCVEVMLADNVDVLPCGHKFHSKCIKEWLRDHNTCPNCRKTA